MVRGDHNPSTSKVGRAEAVEEEAEPAAATVCAKRNRQF